MYEQVAGCVDGIAAVIEIDFKGLYQFSTVFKIIVQQRFEPLCQRQLGKRPPAGAASDCRQTPSDDMFRWGLLMGKIPVFIEISTSPSPFVI